MFRLNSYIFLLICLLFSISSISAADGRYIFIEDKYVMDTETGSFWELIFTGRGETVLIPVEYQEGQETAVKKKVKTKAKKEKETPVVTENKAENTVVQKAAPKPAEPSKNKEKLSQRDRDMALYRENKLERDQILTRLQEKLTGLKDEYKRMQAYRPENAGQEQIRTRRMHQYKELITITQNDIEFWKNLNK